MQTNCKNCQQSFEITDSDLKFYDKISPIFNNKKYQIPAPTLCPECRQQRRFAWRNERNLYHRKCNKTGKQIISMYKPEAPFPVYCSEEWFSDKWDGIEFSQIFDFSRSFFEQFEELMNKIPHLSLISSNNENCDFCNMVASSRNCYLIFGSTNCENCYYGNPYKCIDCIDSLLLFNSELCYECMDSKNLYNCIYCQNCSNSNDLKFCFEVINSKNCLACIALNKKEFCILNKQYTKEEYKKIIEQTDFSDSRVIKEMYRQLNELKLIVPHKYYVGNNNENFSGNYIYNSKNCYHAFHANDCEDVKYSYQNLEVKDAMDIGVGEYGEMHYEDMAFYKNSFTSFCFACWDGANNLFYCSNCTQNTNNCFGCVGLKHKEYCILNKQYSKSEYEKLVPRIIESMMNPPNPLSFKGGTNLLPLSEREAGRDFEWGEFFPISISPFAYNETVAQEYFPLTKEESLARGYKWKDEDENYQHQGHDYQVPNNINDVKDDITEAILKCEATGKLYKMSRSKA
jgi:hypothetical protein